MTTNSADCHKCTNRTHGYCRELGFVVNRRSVLANGCSWFSSGRKPDILPDISKSETPEYSSGSKDIPREETRQNTRQNAGAKIIAGLRDAIAGDFTRVTIEGQTWVRADAGSPDEQLGVAMGKIADLTVELDVAKARAARLDWIIAEDLGNSYLIMTLAKIREVTGVGCKPMLDELPDANAAKMQPNLAVDNAKHPVADRSAPGVT